MLCKSGGSYYIMIFNSFYICLRSENKLGIFLTLPRYQQETLIGRRYKAEKRTNGAKDSFRGNQYTRDLVFPQNEEVPNCKSTAKRIADVYCIGWRSKTISVFSCLYRANPIAFTRL